MLLEAGISADTALDGASALLLAVRQADPAIVCLLLKHKADPGQLDSTGTKSLHAAVVSASAASGEIMEALLAAGASPSARDESGMTPLMLALSNNRKAAIELLLRGKPAHPGSLERERMRESNS